MGMFKDLFRKKPSHDSERALKEVLITLVEAPTIEAKRKIIEANPGLLTDTALRLQEEAAEAAARQGHAKASELLLANLSMLQECREVGIEAAFADVGTPPSQNERMEELQKIFEEIGRSARLEEMPRRVELCRQALEVVKREEAPQLWAELRGELANSLAQSPCGEPAENLEQAIAAYESALEVLTRKATPIEWAQVQMNLAIAYADRIRGDRAENLEQAIAGYEAALQVRTREAMPAEWAETQMRLAITYADRIRGEWAENLERAIAGFEAVLEVWTRKAMPVDWALAQVNVAIAYAKRIHGDRAENLEQAIAGFEAALQVRTRKAMPAEWARTQMQLASSFFERIRGEHAENLERAIAGYEAALEVQTREAMPVEWATTQVNLAGAYTERVRGERAENLERAIAGCEAALEILTRNVMTADWARTQMNLATAYSHRIHGEPAENLERAIAGYEVALEVLTREAMPVEWARTQMNLAFAFARRIRGPRAENLERAIAGYEAALEALTPRPVDWARTQMNLASAHMHRIRGDRAENVERAIVCCEAALGVLTRKAIPLEWAKAQVNLAIAHVDRLRGERAENLEWAIAGYEAALQVQTREAMPLDWATTQDCLATAYLERVRGEKAENLERAITGYEAALQVRTRKGMPVDWAATQTNLAGAYAERIHGDRADNLERAIAGHEAALEVRTRKAMPLEWATTQTNLANAYDDRICGDHAENLERAIAGYHAALEVLTQEAMPMEHLHVQLNFGHLLLKEKRWKAACSTFRQAMETEEVLYQTAATPEARRATLQEFPNIHPELAYALAQEGGTRNLEEAITVAECGRARAMAETLALDEAPLRAARPEDRQAFGCARERIEVLQAEVRLSEGSPGRRPFLAISCDLGKAYAEMQKVVGQIRAYVPEFLPETRFGDIEKAAATCPLVYLIATALGGVGLLVDTGGDVSPVWLPELATGKLHDQVVRYFDAYSQRGTKLETWMTSLDGILRWLWDAGVGSLVSALGGYSEAVLVPGGLLGLLPLHAAWRPDRNAVTGRCYAFDSVTFRYAPSARALIAAARSAGQISPDAILAVDDPRPVYGSALPNSAREVESAIRHFKRRHVLRHEAATRDSLQAEMAMFPVLHFSCHGFANFREPLEGGLVMANDEILSLRGFLGTRLPKARLAVLSACETAISLGKLPDEALSLPSGLLQAGVDGVVGSLWSVPEESTMALMCRFYDLWREEGVPLAEALRRAQQWVRDTTNGEKLEYFERSLTELPGTRMAAETGDSLYDQFSVRDAGARDFSHPFHWAAFCYLGV